MRDLIKVQQPEITPEMEQHEAELIAKGITFDEFMKHCTAQGGNWTSMLFSGMRELYPCYHKRLPDVTYSFIDVIKRLQNDLHVILPEKQ